MQANAESAGWQMDDFLQALRREGLSAKSRKAYEYGLTSFHRWFLHADGSAPQPRAVGREHVAEFLGHQFTVGRLSPATVNQQLAGLRRYFGWARAQRLTDHNPAEKVRRVQQQGPESRALTREEVLRLYRAAREGRRHAERDVAILSLLYGAGLRLSQVVNLNVDDFEKTPAGRDWTVITRDSKGGKHRKVPLIPDVRDAIQHYPAVRLQVPEQALLSSRLKRLSDNGLYRVLGRLGARAGVEVTPHMLRHSFGRHLHARGVPLADIATLMGHESIQTTLRYAQPTRRELRRLLNEKLAFGPRGKAMTEMAAILAERLCLATWRKLPLQPQRAAGQVSVREEQIAP